MKKRFYIPLLAAAILFPSCKKKHEPDPPVAPSGVAMTTVVYAVNRSSLSSDFPTDLDEMLRGLKKVADKSYRLLVYRTDSDTQCGLYEAVADSNGDYQLQLLKSYPRDVTSTHPERMAKVLDDACSQYPDSRMNLFFWGHGTSWTPNFSGHQVKAPVRVEQPEAQSYGGEYNGEQGYGKPTDWIDIDDLADAIPSGRFETIWFDCCYMAGIENAYQLRDKCDYLVAYPTEVWQEGLNYDVAFPYIMSPTPDLQGAAASLYDFYSKDNDAVTVTVMRMDRIEAVADAVKRIYAKGNQLADVKKVSNYARFSAGPFYDLSQYVAQVGEAYGVDAALLEQYRQAMEEFVVYKAFTPYNFNNRTWTDPALSGVSTHHYTGDTSTSTAAAREEYYRTLAWYQRVY